MQSAAREGRSEWSRPVEARVRSLSAAQQTWTRLLLPSPKQQPRSRTLPLASDWSGTVGAMPSATTTDWITASSAVVAALGTTAAAVAAWRSAEASRRASKETAEAFVTQMEREAALAVDAALRALEVDAQGDQWPAALGAFHNRWQDGAAIPAMRLRDTEVRRRVQIVGYILFLATQAAKDEHTSFAFLAAVEDARAALEAFLKNEALPTSTFPEQAQLTELCPIRRDGRSFDPLNEWLAKHFPGFRQL